MVKALIASIQVGFSCLSYDLLWSFQVRNKVEQPSKGTFSSLVTFTNIDKIF